MVLPLPQAMGSTRNMLASLGLRWWQHMIVIGVHELCRAAEVTGPTKAALHPAFDYVHRMLPFRSHCTEDDLSSKSHLQ